MKTRTVISILILAFIVCSCMPIKKTQAVLLTQTITVISTSTFLKIPTATKTQMPTLTPYPPKGPCPLDLSEENVDFFGGYSENHLGLDIAAPEGTSHYSPGDCHVLYFFVQTDGCQGVQLRCNNFPSVDRLSLAHIDLSQKDYETLRYYGIPKDEIYNEDGKIKSDEFRQLFPSKSDFTSWGNDLHIYSGNTGKSGLPHTHISIWTKENGNLDEHNDPLEFLNCQD